MVICDHNGTLVPLCYTDTYRWWHHSPMFICPFLQVWNILLCTYISIIIIVYCTLHVCTYACSFIVPNLVFCSLCWTLFPRWPYLICTYCAYIMCCLYNPGVTFVVHDVYAVFGNAIFGENLGHEVMITGIKSFDQIYKDRISLETMLASQCKSQSYYMESFLVANMSKLVSWLVSFHSSQVI